MVVSATTKKKISTIAQQKPLKPIDAAIKEYKHIRDNQIAPLEKRKKELHTFIHEWMVTHEYESYSGITGYVKRKLGLITRHCDYTLAKTILDEDTYSRLVSETEYERMDVH